MAEMPGKSPENHGLEELRRRIDGIDEQLVDLLNARARVVVEIGKLKQQNNAPIYALMQTLAGARSRALAVATHLFIVNLIGLTIGPLLIGFLNDELRASLGEQGIRYSMMIAGLTNAVAAIFYMAGARTVRRDVAASR